ncbi:MAG: DinB family protein [Chloroflexota bacterium]
MTLTLLLDLDDTLLDSNMENFIPAYFQALSSSLNDIVSPDIMFQALIGGTKRMMENKDPQHFLSEVFEEYFYPKIGIEKKVLFPRINKFYDDIFPDLQYLTKQRQDSIDFVNWAIKEDIKIVIATNPLFPLKAIYHRLRWAGLDPKDYPFAMVTTYENSHFTKENISYFPEILGKLGWPDGSVVMVGNDIKMDIEPAMAAGLPVFWINNEVGGAKERHEIPQGRMDDLRSWLEGSAIESLLYSSQKPTALIAAIRSIPAILETFFSDLDEEKMNYRTNKGDWSIKEVICHLRDVEIEVNLPRIQKILSLDNTFVKGVNTDPWVNERNYSGQNVEDAFKRYIKTRLETLCYLDNNKLRWDTPVRHSFFGSSTLHELVSVMVEHDKAHIQQIHRLINHSHEN